MKRIAIFCVNYNSYNELADYIASLDKAAAAAPDVSVDVFAVDNTDKNFRHPTFDASSISVTVFGLHSNAGYFPGIRQGMDRADMQAYDYHIISNVDVLVDTSFFTSLSAAEYDGSIGIVAPEIYSKTEDKHRNPGRIARYRRRELKVMQMLYRHPRLYALYYNKVYLRRKPSKSELQPQREIYLAHGSFIILTRSFYERCGKIDYPVFLYGEEIYLAELCRSHNLKTIYDPSLKVTDIDHVSTGKIEYKRWCRYNSDALTYILDKVFKD